MTDNAGNQQSAMDSNNASAMDTSNHTDKKSTATVESLQAELVEVRKALKDANKEAQSRRQKLDDFEAKEKAANDAKLSEVERLQNQVNEANAAKESALKTANDRLIRSEILSKSTKFIDPDVVIALVDKSKVTVKDDGTVEGVDAVLDELAKSKPHLLKSNASRLGATNPGANATQNETRAQKHARLEGHNPDVFSSGGGVFWGESPKE